MTGPIPPQIAQLTKLETFSLQGNSSLSGPLPVNITQLTNLEGLYLSGSQVCVLPLSQLQVWLDGIESKSGVMMCPNPERDALIALFHRAGGPDWTNSANWNSFEPLGDWHGVTTDQENMVSGLALENNNLSGSLPGQLSNLVRLETLNLSDNPALAGAIPLSFTRLDLEELLLEGTQLCAPADAAFQHWLSSIPQRATANCTDTRPGFYALEALYNSTNGPSWTNNTNWLSKSPLNSWYGVRTNSSGEVTELNLRENNLQGQLPPHLGQLDKLTSLNLERSQLAGPIPGEIGQLKNLTYLHLGYTDVTGPIPSEIGQLHNLTFLALYNNNLSGTLPPEIGQLERLEILNIAVNQLSGPIPPEIGQLRNLQELLGVLNRLKGSIPPEIGQLRSLRRIVLWGNRLSGPIPPEVGQLQNLHQLDLSGNKLTGTIPTEVGRLRALHQLDLSYNQLTGSVLREIQQLQRLTTLGLADNLLTGPIPPEIGQLQDLSSLDLSGNRLSGPIPPEIGQLQRLSRLNLAGNALTGTIPAEVGQLRHLTHLNLVSNMLMGSIPSEIGRLNMLEAARLSFNQLTGNLPSTLANLASLRALSLTDNAGMAGALPLALTRLALDELLLGGTQLCAPDDAEFREWLRATGTSRVARCLADGGNTTAYLIQATQSLDYPVPLVAGEDALLRVFITSGSDIDAAMPSVRAIFYQGGTDVHAEDIPRTGNPIPSKIDEGDLSKSANARIPGWVMEPGLEMVLEIDPDRQLDPALGISGRPCLRLGV